MRGFATTSTSRAPNATTAWRLSIPMQPLRWRPRPASPACAAAWFTPESTATAGNSSNRNGKTSARASDSLTRHSRIPFYVEGMVCSTRRPIARPAPPSAIRASAPRRLIREVRTDSRRRCTSTIPSPTGLTRSWEVRRDFSPAWELRSKRPSTATTRFPTHRTGISRSSNNCRATFCSTCLMSAATPSISTKRARTTTT